jgi:hypothetical protein
MFTEEIRTMLAQVLTSWQVWAVTVVLILYISLVNYAARARRRKNNSGRLPGFRRRKKAAKVKFNSAPEIVSGDDELGLEDAGEKQR